MSWNVRGLGSAQKRVQIKHDISFYCPNVVCLIETKLDVVNNLYIKSLWSLISINWVYKKAEGRSGGIIVMWDDTKHKIQNYIEGYFLVSINIMEADGFSWGFLLYMALPEEKTKNTYRMN